jgi:hypothetical protein
MSSRPSASPSSSTWAPRARFERCGGVRVFNNAGPPQKRMLHSPDGTFWVLVSKLAGVFVLCVAALVWSLLH